MCAVVAFWAAFIALLVNLPADREFDEAHGCHEGPVEPGTNYPGSFLYPYGAVHSCRVLASRTHWFGGVDRSTVLRLETDRGMVVLRVDYRNLDAGRQYTARGVELTPDDAGDLLGRADRERLSTDIGSRGGISREPWLLAYGDG
jgi:hypothetical protein